MRDIAHSQHPLGLPLFSNRRPSLGEGSLDVLKNAYLLSKVVATMNSRQIRLLGICAVLVLLVLYYVSNGAKNTRQSAFYLNTLSVLNSKQGHSSGGGGGNKIDLDSPEEKLKIENYKKAMRELALQFDPAGEDGARADVYREQLKKQQTEQAPLAPDALGIPKSEGDAPPPPAPAPDAKEPALPPPVADSAPADPIPAEQEKSVAGRKKMKGDKIIPGRPGVIDESVDKSGNIGSPSRGDSDAQTAEADDAHKIETELNDILKRSPLVVFSKSYCPYSRKAKVSLFLVPFTHPAICW